MVLEELDIHKQKEWSCISCLPTHKYHLLDLYVKADTIKLFGENIGLPLYDPGEGRGFLDATPNNTSGLSAKRKKWKDNQQSRGRGIIFKSYVW